MTKQDAFTLMVQHLRTQGAPSFTYKDGSLNCLYRHPDGIKRCAVGVLIMDKDYTRNIENKGVGGLLIDHPHLGWLAPLNYMDEDSSGIGFLQRMQSLHDSVIKIDGTIKEGFLDLWENGFRKIARDHGLSVPEHPCKDKGTVEVAVTQAETLMV